MHEVMIKRPASAALTKAAVSRVAAEERAKGYRLIGHQICDYGMSLLLNFRPYPPGHRYAAPQPERMTIEQLDAACEQFAEAAQHSPSLMAIHRDTLPVECIAPSDEGLIFYTSSSGRVICLEVQQ